jgi:putative copper resistance protein D
MEFALIVCRFLHYWAALTLFGLLVSQHLLLRPDAQHLRQSSAPVWLAGAGLLSALGWLMLTSASMAGSWNDGIDPTTLSAVLGRTAFGNVWIVHMSLNALLILLLMGQRQRPLLQTLVALMLLGSLAPVGHVAMFEGMRGLFLTLNQLIHLGSTGAWLGGLYLLLRLMRGSNDGAARACLLRFSGYGYVMVALIIGTGLINVRALAGALWPSPAFSGFGLILAIKVAMVLCMLALALTNRLMLRSAAARVDILRSSIMLESLFRLAALAAVSLLGTLPPIPE